MWQRIIEFIIAIALTYLFEDMVTQLFPDFNLRSTMITLFVITLIIVEVFYRRYKADKDELEERQKALSIYLNEINDDLSITVTRMTELRRELENSGYYASVERIIPLETDVLKYRRQVRKMQKRLGLGLQALSQE